MMAARGKSLLDRRRTYRLLDEGLTGDTPSKLLDYFLIVLIISNVLAAVLDTVPAFHARYETVLYVFEVVSVLIFTLEYSLRVWVAPEHLPHSHRSALKARIMWMTSPAGLIDLFAILPFYLSLLIPLDLRFLRIFRLLRFFKLSRYSAGLNSLSRAIFSERRALVGSLVIMMGLVLSAASLAWLAEHQTQPDTFGSIPQAMWWAVATLTTVGYGDVVPVTVVGKMLGGVVMLLGLAMFALPVGIVATAFAQEIHRREFIVTWAMVARVPLFSGLGAADVADIMQLLHARSANAGEIIARRGDPASSMYFIVTGSVDVKFENENVCLNAGEFFGEVALLRKATRSATVTARERTNLLVLDATDLHGLMERRPEVAKRIREVMKQRVGAERLTPHGDIVSEELEGREEG